MTTTTTAQPAPARLAWASLIWIGALHVGALLAFVPAYFSWSGLAVCFFLHWLTGGIGICLTYHRLLTHRSFALRPRWLEYVLTIVGSLRLGGRADRLGRRPSQAPRPLRRGRRHAYAAPRLLLGAHVLVDEGRRRLGAHARVSTRSGAPIFAKTRFIAGSNSYHFVFPLLLFAGLYAVGGMSWLVWGGFVRSVFVLHSTWLVNSASHVWGYRSHPTRDRSTNLWWVALLTYGEGWHNNHHAYQTSARHGLRWWEIDMTYLAIQAMKLCRIAYDIRLPKIRAIRPVLRRWR